MKKIAMIFSVLAISLLATFMMGCPVAYEVAPGAYVPGSNKDLSITAAGEYTIAISDYLKAAYINNDATAVSFSYSVTSSSDWNLDGRVYLTGPFETDNYNLIATKDVNWWSGTTAYYIIGGYGTTYDNNVGGTAYDAETGGALAIYSGSVALDIDSSKLDTVPSITVHADVTPNASNNVVNMTLAITDLSISY